MSPPANGYTLAEAVDLIGRIERGEESVEDYRLRLRWCKGYVLEHTARPFGSAGEIVASIVEELWRLHGIRSSKTQLYECRRVYRAVDGDVRKYETWIQEMKAHWNRPVRWGDVQRYILGGRNNPDVIGREAADQRDFLDAERGVEALEKIILRANEGNEEAIGVVEGIRQSLEGLTVLPYAKPTTPRSEAFLAFVRSHSCVVCRQPAEAHHAFGRAGIGEKASDFTCVPLCRRHHRDFHRHGRATFERMHQIGLIEVAFNLVHRYFAGAWVTLNLPRAETMDS